MLGVVAEVEHGDRDGGPEECHERDDRHQRHHRQTGRQRHVLDDGLVVLGGRVAGQARHDRGQDGDTEDAVRQLQQLPVREVGADAALRGRRRDPVGDHHADLQHQHVADDRHGHVAELAQPRVDTPLQAQPDPGATQPRHQDHRLQHHAERAADAEHEELRVAHLDRVERDLTRHQPERHQRRDLHDVVEDGRPRTRLEKAAHVEDRDEQRGQAVEQDLRQQQIRQRRRQIAVDLAVADVEEREHGRGDHCDDRRHPQDDHHQREDLVGERLAAVGVLGLGPGQQRDHDRGEDGAQHHLGDHVGQDVGRLERRRETRTQHRQDQDGAQEAGDPAEQRRQGDRAARLEDRRVGVLGGWFVCVGGRSVGFLARCLEESVPGGWATGPGLIDIAGGVRAPGARHQGLGAGRLPLLDGTPDPRIVRHRIVRRGCGVSRYRALGRGPGRRAGVHLRCARFRGRRPAVEGRSRGVAGLGVAARCGRLPGDRRRLRSGITGSGITGPGGSARRDLLRTGARRLHTGPVGIGRWPLGTMRRLVR